MTEVFGYYEVVTGPVSSPISLSEAKSFLRVEYDDDDDLITTIIASVKGIAEKITNRTLSSQTVKASFPKSEPSGKIFIHSSPVTSINSVKLYDSESDSFIATADYTFTPDNSTPSIDFGTYIPLDSNIPFTIEVEFVSGGVSPDMIQAMKNHINFLYENRGDVTSVGSLAAPVESMMVYKLNRIIPGFA